MPQLGYLYTALPEAGLEQEFGTCEQALVKYIQNRNNMNEAEGSAETSQEPLTRGDVVDLLMAAADEYQPNLQKTDIMKGYEDGLLHEDMKATKLEALIMLNRAFGTLPESSTSGVLSVDTFTDIPEWAKPEMEKILQSGIV